jgi:hypothetical protein
MRKGLIAVLHVYEVNHFVEKWLCPEEKVKTAHAKIFR